jgi:hypothetical protein
MEYDGFIRFLLPRSAARMVQGKLHETVESWAVVEVTAENKKALLLIRKARPSPLNYKQ